VLEARLTGRGSETEASLKRRLETAKQELEYFNSGAKFHYELKNDNLSIAYQSLRSKLIEVHPHLQLQFPTSIHSIPVVKDKEKVEEVEESKKETVITISSTEERKQQETETRVEQPRPLVICGPSGVGKGTLLTMLTKDFPNVFKRTTSHTTRKPRQGEQNGVDYFFVTKEEFLSDVKEKKIY